MFSFASVLDAWALVSGGSRGVCIAAGEIGSIVAASLTGFSQSKFLFSAHPARARASSTANRHFIFALRRAGQTHILPHHVFDGGGKRNEVERKVADLLISGSRTKCPLWVKSRHLQRKNGMSAFPPKADICSAPVLVRFGPKADMRPGRPVSQEDPLFAGHLST